MKTKDLVYYFLRLGMTIRASRDQKYLIVDDFVEGHLCNIPMTLVGVPDDIYEDIINESVLNRLDISAVDLIDKISRYLETPIEDRMEFI